MQGKLSFVLLNLVKVRLQFFVLTVKNAFHFDGSTSSA